MTKRKNDEMDKYIGAKFRYYREQKGLTQQDIADKLGVTKTAVSNWETGDRAMYLSIAKRYCKVLDISISDIFNE